MSSSIECIARKCSVISSSNKGMQIKFSTFQWICSWRPQQPCWSAKCQETGKRSVSAQRVPWRSRMTMKFSLRYIPRFRSLRATESKSSCRPHQQRSRSRRSSLFSCSSMLPPLWQHRNTSFIWFRLNQFPHSFSLVIVYGIPAH